VAAKPVAKRLVVLVSGSGTNLQALLDTIETAGVEAYGAEIVAVARTGRASRDSPVPSAPGCPPSCAG